MYKSYWGLIDAPFENVPDPSFLYESPQHKEALSRMLYGISRRKGCVMLTGEIGSGKTTLSRTLIQRLPRENFEVALIENPKLTPLLFIQEIIYQFTGENVDQKKTNMLHHLNRILYKNVSDDKESVIVIDEAQLIETKETFEELRLLLNFQLNDRFLLTLILIGQPELKQIVNSIPQFEQRVAIKYHLQNLSYEEMVKYIEFRLKRAGLNRNVFTIESMEKIFNYSGGTPRKINNICDMGLLVGWNMKSKYVDSSIISNLLSENKNW
ncbi:MAG: AAA family ATPase [Deltaproteobacteria bacterium]|uniref:AAA family ATPase n=1 Tax=Candidatus Zymogenus saltonus TaxID=2844893 RepID=A0A9D8KFM5_9DELT|nr:AAA family ATPase [Candidatus Zymogenus saltonus]